MKWITTNYKGEKVVWYSGDLIEKIKELASPHCSECKKILEIIENEEK